MSLIQKGSVWLVNTIFLGVVSWFTPEHIDTTIKIITGTGAVISTVFTVRYFYYATKEKKETLKRLK